METEKILFLRNFLFRTFLIGLVIAIVLGLVTIAFWHSLVPWAAGLIGIQPAEVRELTIVFFMDIRIILIFFMLTPALGLHWMYKSKKV